MPNLSDHQSSETTKLLLIGDNGSGKSGALASLASAGYNLRILDLDNGLDILKNVLRDPKAGYASDSISRVVYETLTDKMKASGGKLVPSQATVWQRAIKLLDNWKTESHSLGPLVSWTPKDVLVIDSLTMLSNAAMNFVLSMNARLGQQPHQSDWYVGQQMIESLLQMLFDENVRCNVVMNCHITFIGEENGPVRGYPASLGKALPPKIGSYFNTILMAQAVGQGANAKQKILTRTQGMIGLKTSAPGLVASEYPIETGLAEYFKAIRGVPAAAATVSKPALVAKTP